MSDTFEILPYSSDVIANHISLVTETPFHQLRQKKQIKYLDSYIQQFLPKPQKLFAIIEYDYIEKHYLEDYAKYFSKCLHEYPRKCSRIHIFDLKAHNFKLDKQSFTTILKSNDPTMIAALSDGYMGYIIIRPIPSTVFAKVCLKPYELVKPNIITRTYEPSLFGISLKVESVAFQEQDRILSACATSALWSLYNAHNCINLNIIPSPNTITAEAVEDEYIKRPGLSETMICRSMKKNGLSPRFIPIENDDPEYYTLREHIHAYCTSKIPLIMGVKISEKEQEGKGKRDLGLHAVTVLGFGLKSNNSISKEPNNQPLKMVAHNIDRIYVHDDRVGPFARLELCDGKWEMKVTSTSDETYSPQSLIFGTYHKIRIPFIDIKKTCITFVKRLKISINLRMDEKSKIVLSKVPDDLLWDISIKSNHTFKRQVITATHEILNKEDLLLSSLPLYIWVAAASYKGVPLFDLLFDPTDIPQGNVFLNVVYRNELGKELISYLRDDCRSNYFKIVNENCFSGMPQEDHFGGIVNYFLQDPSHHQMLNSLFGEMKLPQYFKPGDIEEDAILKQNAALFFSSFDNQDYKLQQDRKYIWAINKEGGLLLGYEESDNSNSSFRGHITLTQGRPARIAGELIYLKDKWLINSKSGRYTTGYSEDDIKKFLDNVCKQRFKAIFPDTTFSVDHSSKPHTNLNATGN